MSRKPRKRVAAPVVLESILSDDDRERTVKKSAALPTWSDIGDAFGEQAVRDKRINLDLETRDGRRNRGRLRDMMKPWTRLEHESGMVMNASTPRTKVRAPDGRVREIPAAAESHVAQRPGYRPVEQRKPTLIWRDGIWYRRARGGYVAEPAN